MGIYLLFGACFRRRASSQMWPSSARSVSSAVILRARGAFLGEGELRVFATIISVSPFCRGAAAHTASDNGNDTPFGGWSQGGANRAKTLTFFSHEDTKIRRIRHLSLLFLVEIRSHALFVFSCLRVRFPVRLAADGAEARRRRNPFPVSFRVCMSQNGVFYDLKKVSARKAC